MYRYLSITILLVTILLTACDNDSTIITDSQDSVSIKLNKENITLEIGSKTTLVAGFSPSDTPNKAHTWTSADPTIATVDETGNVKGISAGETEITATALVNKTTATCKVTVVNKIIRVTSVSLNSKEETLITGDKFQLIATINPETATDQTITWSSSNMDCAKVDDNGLITAYSPGTARITAKVDEKTATCNITVTEKTVEFTNETYSSDDTSITFRAEINSVGITIDELGVCWTQGKAPSVEDSRLKSGSTKKIDLVINNLTPDKSYFVRGYAKSGTSVYYSKTFEITTLPVLITNFILESVTYDVKEKKGDFTFTSDIIRGYSSLNVCFGPAPNPEITDELGRAYSSDNDKYKLELSGLKDKITYYLRAYEIKNNKPVYYSNEIKFSTFGLDVVFSSSPFKSNSNEQIFKLDYTLPGTNLYEISTSTSFPYSCKFGKNSTHLFMSEIYVEGGKGTIYYDYAYKSIGYGYIIFKNMDNNVTYKLLLK